MSIRRKATPALVFAVRWLDTGETSLYDLRAMRRHKRAVVLAHRRRLTQVSVWRLG